MNFDLETNWTENASKFAENISLVQNATDDNFASLKRELKPVIDILILIILLLIMLSMGCEITWTEVLAHIKKPIGIGIGLLSQFVVMPLTAYTWMKSAGITGFYATGILIIACCPGGVLSNAFVMFCDGDLSLSCAMTTFSTILAMGMMPLNLWLYGHSFQTKDLVIPYASLAFSLLLITTPVLVGMLTRWKLPYHARIISKVAAYVSPILILTTIVMQAVAFPELFSRIPSRLYSIVLTLPFVGMFLGYVLAFLFRQNLAVRKAIGIECGIQNVPTALGIITLSFKQEIRNEIILLPWLYGMATMSMGCLFCFLYQIYKRWMKRRDDRKALYELRPISDPR